AVDHLVGMHDVHGPSGKRPLRIDVARRNVKAAATSDRSELWNELQREDSTRRSADSFPHLFGPGAVLTTHIQKDCGGVRRQCCENLRSVRGFRVCPQALEPPGQQLATSHDSTLRDAPAAAPAPRESELVDAED